MWSAWRRAKELQRRLGLRVREASGDARERAREATELAALRRRVWGARPADDPAALAAYERARAAHDAQYAPRLLIDVSLQLEQQRERERQRAEQREEARREVTYTVTTQFNTRLVGGFSLFFGG